MNETILIHDFEVRYAYIIPIFLHMLINLTKKVKICPIYDEVGHTFYQL